MSAPTPEWPGSAFWDFSLRAYSQPEVESVCLALQDDKGLDVNLVLLATWAAGTGRRLDSQSAERLRRFGGDYQTSVMRPLRQARRALKSVALGSELVPLLAERRQALLAIELDLERLEQLQLAAMTAASAPSTDPPAAAAMLLEANLRSLYPDCSLPPAALAVLAAVLPMATRSLPRRNSVAKSNG